MLRLLTSITLFVTSLSLSVGAPTFQSVYSFPADGSRGKQPAATLTVGPDSQLYGTALQGGANNLGAVFKISTDGAPTHLGDLELATTGRNPEARLVSMEDGFLYGVSKRNGGTAGDPAGTVFKVDPAGGLSVVFQLPGGGATPKLAQALVATDATTLQVLGASPAGLWQVTTSGGGTNTYTFGSTAADGVFAYSLIRGADGRLYGTTEGINYVGTDPGQRGTLFRIEANGTGMTKLHDCLQATGTSPHGAMVQALDGNFYGTMSAGGASGYGTIFRLTPGGDYTVIHEFDDLKFPLGDLMQATDGYLYGTARTYGTINNSQGGVFRIKTDGTGYQVLHNFTGTNGANPTGGLVQANDGNLYGTTVEGGAGGVGTVFRIKLDLPPPNRAPVALDDIGVTTGDAVTINVLDNDFDPEGGALTLVDYTTPAFGTVTVLGDNTLQYEPGMDFTGTDSFIYAVSDPEGLMTTATVTIQSEPVGNVVYSGVFNGLLNLDPELTGDSDLPRAQIIVGINELGKFTGVLLTQRKRVALRGEFDLTDGTGVAKVKIGKSAAVVFLAFRQDEPGTLLAVVFGREVWFGSARPSRASALSTTDKHTVALEPLTTSLPDGYGYGLMQIKSNGLVRCVGKHGDGTRLSWGTMLVSSPDNAALLPVFAEPLAGGVCAGVLDSRIASSFDFVGNLRWIRPPARRATLPYPNGFDGITVGGTSRFTPAPGLSGMLQFGPDAGGSVLLHEGPLTNPITGLFTIVGPPPPTLRIAPTVPLKSLVINRNTGLITGKVLNGTKPLSFTGVVLQGANFGAGQFFIGGTSGYMELNP